MNPWIGVDLDGTLAKYHGWRGETHIGEPIPAMVERVRRWLIASKEVRIFTARAAPPNDEHTVKRAIWKWLHKVGLPELAVTSEKDFGMVELWDDRCVQVDPNTGYPLVDSLLVLAKHARGDKVNPEQLAVALYLAERLEACDGR